MVTCMRARRSSKFGQVRPPTAELAALERLKKSPYTYNWKNGVAPFSQLFLIRSLSYFQVIMTYIRVWMSLKFGLIRLWTIELAALKRPKNRCCHVFSVTIYLIYFKFVGTVLRTCIIPRRSSSFDQIGLHNMELSAVDRLKITTKSCNAEKGASTFFFWLFSIYSGNRIMH